MVAFCYVRCLLGRRGVETCRLRQVAIALMQVRGDRVIPRYVGVECRQSPKPGPRTIGLPDRDGTVQPGDGAVGEPYELVVPFDDLYPVGFLDRKRIRMQRCDSRLCLELAESVTSQRGLQDVDSLGDQFGIPEVTILVRERYETPVGARAGRPAGMVQEHQRQ